LGGGLVEVIGAGFGFLDPHDQAIMRPAQFSTQCVEFFLIGIGEIELAEVPEIRHGKTTSEFVTEAEGEFFDEFPPVSGAGFAFLLLLDNPGSDAPVGFHHDEIDAGGRFATGFGENFTDGAEEGVVWN
jgi:hypothetical protein